MIEPRIQRLSPPEAGQHRLQGGERLGRPFTGRESQHLSLGVMARAAVGSEGHALLGIGRGGCQ